MGTRADFYVGRGEQMEWLGSFCWDGYPGGEAGKTFTATTEDDYRNIVDEHLSTREDWTRPDEGWPWPWKDSATTDYAYTFDDGKVYVTIGYPVPRWVPADWVDIEDIEERIESGNPEWECATCVFPDMSARKNVQLNSRKGGILIMG